MRSSFRRYIMMLMVYFVVAWSGEVSRADVRLPALFTEHMVVQREMPIAVWGMADAGEQVTVALAGQTESTAAGTDGRWSVKLSALPAGGPHQLVVEGKNRIAIGDVLVGEVWVCAGQSNMQWPVSIANNPDLEIQTANYPHIRLITVPQVGTQDQQFDFQGQWDVCSPATVSDFSAVGYFFGRQLSQTLNVPIGLIDNSWGGSAAEAWVRRDLLAGDAQYAALLAKWAEIEAKNDDPGQLAGNHRPGNLYCGVLKPVIGYGIRGTIWYQGESNAGRAYQYRHLFPLMIQSWREEWGQGDFPFYWVQLADFQAEVAEPQESAWAELREAQTMTLSLPNTGQAVIIDIGEANDIHPRNKQEVAMRLARLALARDYGLQVVHQSPQFKSMEIADNKATIHFDHPGQGLVAFDVDEVRGFAIAGEDHKFVWASAKITGPDTVEVWSDAVTHPVAVRYAWSDNPICNLRSRDGLPVTPFRTDDWPGVTANVDR